MVTTQECMYIYVQLSCIYFSYHTYLQKYTKQVSKHFLGNFRSTNTCLFVYITSNFIAIWAKWSQTWLTRIVRVIPVKYTIYWYMLDFQITDKAPHKLVHAVFGCTPTATQKIFMHAKGMQNEKWIQSDKGKSMWFLCVDAMSIKPVTMLNYTCFTVVWSWIENSLATPVMPQYWAPWV